jgi:type I restriction enzyme S subunit
VEPNKIANPGDILISVRAPVGPTNVANMKCCIGRGLAAIRCGGKVDSDFILDALRRFENKLVQKGSGSTFEAISRDDLEKLAIPLPPLIEQRRIAGVLREQMATVEKARAAAQARLEAVKALPAAFLRQVFPQPGQPLLDGWRWVKLGEVCKLVGGSTPDTGTSDYWDGEIVWVTPTDLGKLSDMTITTTGRRITPAGLQSCGTEMLPIGTVIMSSRAPIGHLAIAGVSLCTNQGCKSFVPSPDVDSVFLYWVVKQSVPDIQALGSGATFAEVSKSALQQFAIPLPPLAEQWRIAGVLREQMAAEEKARAAAEEELNTINALPAALLHRAFNGEI